MSVIADRAPAAVLAGANGAERVALGLLDAMERRALAEAKAFIAPGMQMVFPGGARYATLEAMVAGAAGRYQRIGKHVDAVESFEAGGDSIVYVRGRLHGVNAHGVPFRDVRFVDRFAVRADQIVSQDVWNDLAESGVLDRRP